MLRPILVAAAAGNAQFRERTNAINEQRIEDDVQTVGQNHVRMAMLASPAPRKIALMMNSKTMVKLPPNISRV